MPISQQVDVGAEWRPVEPRLVSRSTNVCHVRYEKFQREDTAPRGQTNLEPQSQEVQTQDEESAAEKNENCKYMV